MAEDGRKNGKGTAAGSFSIYLGSAAFLLIRRRCRRVL